MSAFNINMIIVEFNGLVQKVSQRYNSAKKGGAIFHFVTNVQLYYPLFLVADIVK